MVSADTESITDNLLSPHQNNVVTFNETVPTIDGIINETEWINATEYELKAGGRTFTVRVMSNYTHLFMGISYRSSVFVPINDTIPQGEEYNNQTHTWYAIVFDRNFDKKVGSETFPDDVLLVNYRYNGTQDGFIQGSDNDSLVLDTDVGGTNNTYGVLYSEYDSIFSEYDVSFEVTKELNSGDKDGHDIALTQSDTIPFSLIYYENDTAIYNSSKEAAFSDWEYIRLETLHSTYTLVDNVEDVSILTYYSRSKNTVADGFMPVNNYLESYGLDITTRYASTFKLDKVTLSEYTALLLVGSFDQIDADSVEALRSYIAQGGKVLLLADATRRNNRINDILSHFQMEAYTSPLYLNDTSVNASLSITVDEIDTTLSYLSKDLSLINKTLEEIFYIGTALRFNTTTGLNTIQVQDADLYPIINTTGEYFINYDPIGEYNSSIDLNLNGSAILQAGLELQRGGKLIVCGSADMYNESYFGYANNKELLLRELLWLMDTQFGIQHADFEIGKVNINYGEAITVNISVTTDNNTILNNLNVTVYILRLKQYRQEKNMTAIDGQNFTTDIEPIDSGYLELEVRMHKRGYGYNSTEIIQIYVTPPRADPPSIQPGIVIVFVISIGVAVVGGMTLLEKKKT